MEYNQWLRQNHLAPHEARFIGQEVDLHGLLSPIEVIRVGTWYDNPMANSMTLKSLEERIEREDHRGH